MGFQPSNSLNAIPDVHTRAELKSLWLAFGAVQKSVSTLIRNNEAVVDYTPSSVTLTAGAGLTGGGDLTADRSFAVGAGTGITVAADSVAVDQGFTPTWTGIHTFSAQDVHNAGVSLGTSGVLKSVVASAGVVYDLADGAGAGVRTSGTEFAIRRTADSRTMMEVTWDGRFSFGYSSSGITNMAQTGHVLSFLATDNDSPSGSPITTGILSSVSHVNTAETVTRLVGIAGAAYVVTATGLSAVVVNGVTGAASSSADSSMTGKVLAAFAGVISNSSSIVNTEILTKDYTFAKNAHAKGSYDHVTILWASNLSFSSTTGYPTNKPAVVSAVRSTIQDWGASTTSGTPAGEYWSLYGEHINGATASYPAVTGFMRCVYPRRTAGSGGTTRAMHIWFEPWPMSAAGAGAAGAVRPNAAEGDVYFDDNTNFTGGLWEFSGIAGGANAWNYLLSSPGVDALGGGAAPTLGTIGGTGPAAAAQATWIKVNCADNVVRWVPAWV